MPRINVEIWLTEKELINLREQFDKILEDPDTVYTNDEFYEWIGDKIIDRWRRKKSDD